MRDHASEKDIAVVETQLGRPTEAKIHAVAMRCSHRQPQVVITHPVVWQAAGGDDDVDRCLRPKPKPFPTLYWLTCPYLRDAVSALETGGMLREMKAAAASDGSFRQTLEAAGDRHARERAALLSREEVAWLADNEPAMLDVLTKSGIGGTGNPAGVKCLHMHLADFLGAGEGPESPVGEAVARRINGSGETRGRHLECSCGRCVPVRVAAINAGSNSTKVLVADVVEAVKPGPAGRRAPGCNAGGSGAGGIGSGEPLCDLGRVFRVTSAVQITGLGEGLEATGRLSAAGRERTAEAVAKFVEIARQHDVDEHRIWVTATAAARAAEDRELLVSDVRRASGLDLEIISSELEATLSFAGVLSVPFRGGSVEHGRARQPLGNLAVDGSTWDPRRALVVDIGGASTEFMRLAAPQCTNSAIQSISLPIGAVLLTDAFIKSDPPEHDEVLKMRAHIREVFGGAERLTGRSGGSQDSPVQSVVIVGGSAATLATICLGVDSYEADRVHGYELTKHEVQDLLEKFSAMTYQERSRVRGMIQPERARVMVAASALVLETLNLARVDKAVASVAGILDGMAAYIARRHRP